MRRIEAKQIAEEEASSFTYYSLLPTDVYELSGDWPEIDTRAVAERCFGKADEIEPDVDVLTLALLAHRTKPLPSDVAWHDLADHLSVQYSILIDRSDARRLRMKCARANFFLRDLIDVTRDDSELMLEERTVSADFPWDWLASDEAQIVVDSGKDNVHFLTGAGAGQCHRAGLPSQLDRLPGSISIGSCYSKGWFTTDEAHQCPVFHDHPAPVLLVAEYDGENIGVDAKGNVFAPQSGKTLFSTPVLSAGRARLIDGCIYLIDWARPREIVRIAVDGFRKDIVDVSPVIVPNDICKVDDRFYLIDKMQGRVFSFDEQFEFIDARLSFGKGPGRLYDPISLRVHNGNIAVLSWLTGALTTIKPF